MSEEQEFEFAPFGDVTVYRLKDSADDWLPVPESLQHVAAVRNEVAEALKEVNRLHAGKFAIEVTRGEATVAAADELGLTPDQLAERLADPEQNQGTKNRIDETRFDEIAGSLNLDPQEARDRFSGKFWQG